MHTRALVRLEIVRCDELDRMGGDRWQVQRRADVEQAVDQTLGMRLTEALQLQVVASGKQRGPGFGGRTRSIGLVVEDRLSNVASVATRQRQQAVGAFGQPGGVDFGAAAMDVVLIGACEQFAQAAIAFAVLHQQQQARRPVSVRGVAHPDIAAEYRFDTGAACSTVKLHPAEGIGQVGQAQRRHRNTLRTLDRLGHPNQSI